MARQKEKVMNVLLRYPGLALLLMEVPRAISYGTICVEKDLVMNHILSLKSLWDGR
jgi:hypothetical protein